MIVKDMAIALQAYLFMTILVYFSIFAKIHGNVPSNFDVQGDGAAAHEDEKQVRSGIDMTSLKLQIFRMTELDNSILPDVSEAAKENDLQNFHPFKVPHDLHEFQVDKQDRRRDHDDSNRSSRRGRTVEFVKKKEMHSNSQFVRRLRRKRFVSGILRQNFLETQRNGKQPASSFATFTTQDGIRSILPRGQRNPVSSTDHNEGPSRKELEESNNSPKFSPCKLETDNKETVVNCTGLSLTEVYSYWFPDNTTTLLLNGNLLTKLVNDIFFHLYNLRKLDVSYNKLNLTEINAFRGLENLEVLDLEFNQLSLDTTSYPPGVFAPLTSLRELHLEHNTDASGTSELEGYPENFIGDLTTLTFLSIDTVGETLYFGKEFAKLRNLKTLQLSGGVSFIVDNSFENVKYLTTLIIHDLLSLSSISRMTLQPLHKLDVLRLIRLTCIGLRDALKILEPLAVGNKSMSTVHFEGIFLSRSDTAISILHNDSLLDSDATKFMLKICVRELLLINCDLLVITEDAFVSRLWESCLQNFDLSANQLMGNRLALPLIMRTYKNLQSFKFSDYTCLPSSPDRSFFQCPHLSLNSESVLNSERPKFTVLNSRNGSKKSNEIVHSATQHALETNTDLPDSEVYASIAKKQNNFTISQSVGASNNLPGHCRRISKSDTLASPTFIYYIPDSLRTVDAGCKYTGLSLDVSVHVVGAGNLTYMDASDSNLHIFTGKISGLTSLRILILNGNDLSTLSETFFDTFSQLEELYLAGSKLDRQVMSLKSSRIFQTIHGLKRLDLSSNLLSLLAKDMFSCNPNLQELSLGKNRFRYIPFHLRDTPNLCALDLRENAITSLGAEETRQLDLLAARSGGFRLFLDGNVLSCGCNNIAFLQWLQTTRVHLDQGRNFTCINDQGTLSFTGDYSDTQGLWRVCWGGFFLALSICLFFLIVVGYMSFLLVWKNKTFLISKLRQFVGLHQLTKPTDYKTDVFIGYADDIYEFPCYILRNYIEQELGMRAYLRHRDLEMPSDMASSIMEAINNSWRILLVVSEDFVSEEWSVFTMKSAVYAQTPRNPARIVVLVKEQLQGDLPPELLRTVSEDNLVIVPRLEMTYELREKLRTRLLPV